eukprot:GDKJ01031845.1.p1 GENE.GDKJ01031845.1~~GDKJ01031845.1.p1  ORF type:complete len:553 (-),score=117.76 GDKJ01031845.1:66-1724(-)
MGNSQGTPHPSDINLHQRKSVLYDEGYGVSVASLANKIKRGAIKNVVVCCGAGISVSAGIPDFRSPESGIYSKLQEYNLPQPEAMFDLRFFRRTPGAFNQFIKELFPGNYSPTMAHYFIRMLHEQGILLRCFTQNIDDLETLAGIPPEKIVRAHGSFDGCKCSAVLATGERCEESFPLKEYHRMIMAGETPRCKRRMARKYFDHDDDYPDSAPKDRDEIIECGGYVKPNIVFFGENLPDEFEIRAQRDLPKCDLLIVMGTSLKVQPFASLVGRVHPLCPRLLLNLTAVNVQPRLYGPSQAFKQRRLQSMFDGSVDCSTEEDELAEIESDQEAFKQAQIAKGEKIIWPHFTASYKKRMGWDIESDQIRKRLTEIEKTFFSETDDELVKEKGRLRNRLSEIAAEVEADDENHIDPETGSYVSSALSYEGHVQGQTMRNLNVGFFFWHRGELINYRDLFMSGDCDASVLKLSQVLGWDQKLESVMEKHQKWLQKGLKSSQEDENTIQADNPVWRILLAREKGETFKMPSLASLGNDEEESLQTDVPSKAPQQPSY